MADNDFHIIEQVRAGNTRMYTQLVERYKDRAMTLAVRLVGTREEAEEIVQDAFLRAFRGLKQFRGGARFSTWFYRITYNLCLTHRTRRKPRSSFVEADNQQGYDSALVDSTEISVLDRLQERELHQMVATEIKRLPEKFKTAITLFYVQEMSYEEIADTLRLPVGTVKTNLFRGRNMLRERVLAKLKEEVKT